MPAPRAQCLESFQLSSWRRSGGPGTLLVRLRPSFSMARFSLFRCLDQQCPTVLRIDTPACGRDELERIHDATHGWGLYLFSSGQALQRNWPAKNDYRQRRQPGWAMPLAVSCRLRTRRSRRMAALCYVVSRVFDLDSFPRRKKIAMLIIVLTQAPAGRIS